MSDSPADADAALADYLARPSVALEEMARLGPRSWPRLVLDIGSCEGEDAVRYARAYPEARVLAFEPLPENQRRVAATIARQALGGRVELVPLALSDRTGEARFHVSAGRPAGADLPPGWDPGNKSSSLLAPVAGAGLPGWLDFGREITVPTETLDAVAARRGLGRVDLIHMDVQGAEALVLRGAAATLRRTTALWIEVAERPLYAGQAARSEVEAMLRGAGFARLRHEPAGDGGEADQFHVNLRHPRTWLPWIRRRIGAARLARHRP